jgi:hypothetical protein
LSIIVRSKPSCASASANSKNLIVSPFLLFSEKKDWADLH